MKKRLITMILCCLAAACAVTGCTGDDAEEYLDTAQQSAQQISEKAGEMKEKAGEMKEKAEQLKEKADQLKQEYDEAKGGSESDGSESDGSISLTDLDGYNYRIDCRGEEFSAEYSYDNWRIIDSWRITDQGDMEEICRLLIEEHPIHGSDMESYRTADDMVFEWQQHNIAYQVLPEDNVWRQHAKDVDLDPEDQGRTFEEIYEDRTGQELDIDLDKLLQQYR